MHTGRRRLIYFVIR